MGLLSEIREFVRVSRKLMDGSMPCVHTWTKIAEIADSESKFDRRRVVTMCTSCGVTKSEIFGPPDPPAPPPHQHDWELVETLENWVQPMHYEKKTGNRVPTGDKVLDSKIYVSRCRGCGEITRKKIALRE